MNEIYQISMWLSLSMMLILIVHLCVKVTDLENRIDRKTIKEDIDKKLKKRIKGLKT